MLDDYRTEPVLKHNHTEVSGSLILLASKIMSKRQWAFKELMPEECKDELQLVLNWQAKILNVAVAELFHHGHITQIGKKQRTNLSPDSEHWLKQINHCCWLADAWLKNRTYFCAKTMTLPDIAIYNDFSLFNQIY